MDTELNEERMENFQLIFHQLEFLAHVYGNEILNSVGIYLQSSNQQLEIKHQTNKTVNQLIKRSLGNKPILVS